MKTQRTRAIILRRTNYGEADRILQLLTEQGRRSVIARGVRREKSKLAGGIELFAVSDVVIGEGKGELGVLTSARLVQFYRSFVVSVIQFFLGQAVDFFDGHLLGWRGTIRQRFEDAASG